MPDKDPTLFDYGERYPHAPGAKTGGTSQAAADAVAKRAPTLRSQVYNLLRSIPNGLTADECASALNRSVLSIRPRLSELLATGHIQDSGRTRANISGVQATVWIVPPKDL